MTPAGKMGQNQAGTLLVGDLAPSDSQPPFPSDPRAGRQSEQTYGVCNAKSPPRWHGHPHGHQSSQTKLEIVSLSWRKEAGFTLSPFTHGADGVGSGHLHQSELKARQAAGLSKWPSAATAQETAVGHKGTRGGLHRPGVPGKRGCSPREPGLHTAPRTGADRGHETSSVVSTPQNGLHFIIFKQKLGSCPIPRPTAC